MVNDPIGDMLIQIKNAAMAGNKALELPYSRVKHEVSKILVNENYLISAEVFGESPKLKLKITLNYNQDKPVISDVKRKSKPGLRIYVDKKNIPVVVGGMGTAIISTSSGIMTGKEAKNKGLGGELLCEVW